MFSTLFKNPIDVDRHQSAPYCAERQSYLRHLIKAGYARKTIIQTATCLLRITRELKPSPPYRVSPIQVQRAALRWLKSRPVPPSSERQWTYKTFVQIATQWLMFLGWLSVPEKKQTRFKKQLEDFLIWEKSERGISTRTLETQERHIQTFLFWYQQKRDELNVVKNADIDDFLAYQGRTRWSRRTIATVVQSLRNFFRYGTRCGWCSSSLVDGIEGPCVYRQETLPSGPSWEQVQSIIARVTTDHPNDIRDRAILMLLAIYGLRASEVSQLYLKDVDWDHEQLTVRRTKNKKVHIYPLVPVVGDALIRYLKEVRPHCAYPEVFLKLKAPLGPVSRLSVHRLTNKQFSALEIKTLHRGPHALRHACATHLVAEGFSFKEIGDHLGHSGTSATHIYAKVDLPHLRKVAEFDLGGLL